MLNVYSFYDHFMKLGVREKNYIKTIFYDHFMKLGVREKNYIKTISHGPS